MQETCMETAFPLPLRLGAVPPYIQLGILSPYLQNLVIILDI